MDQVFVVRTRNFRSGPRFCGPDQMKWFRPGKTDLFKTIKKPVPSGSQTTFTVSTLLVQTTKTWGPPRSFSRLLRKR